jgi:type II secretory pathway pseudopilin PulG
VFKVRPLDTIFTSYDEPFWVDIESDRITDVEVYIDGASTPYTVLTTVPPIQRVRVWSEIPIASSPDNQIHRITFKSLATNETVDVYIAYFSTGIERLEFRPSRGLVLMGFVTQLMIIGDKAFFRRLGVRRIAPINAPDDSKVFHEFVGFNEHGDKFYYVIRQDKFLLLYAGNTDAYVTLNPVKNIPVTIDYYIPDIPLLAILPYLGKATEVVEGFINWASGGLGVGEYINRFKIGVARLISKMLGIQQEIIDVNIVENRLRVTYLMDAPPLGALIVIGLAVIAGAYVLNRLVGAIRDIVVEREQTVQTIEVMNSIRKVNEERTKAIEAALQYAREQNLTPQETYSLVELIGEKYTTGDITKAVEALNEADKYKAEAESLRTQRYLWALGGAGVGALITAIAKR